MTNQNQETSLPATPIGGVVSLTAPSLPTIRPGSSEAQQIKPDDPAELTAKVAELMMVVGILASGSLRTHPELQNLVYIRLA
jgi:hypothetical protein